MICDKALAKINTLYLQNIGGASAKHKLTLLCFRLSLYLYS